MTLRSVMGVALVGVVLTSAVVAQQKSPEDIIKGRQEQMKALGADFRIINEALKADAPDLAAISAAGKRIADAIKDVNTRYPAGTGPESGIKTRAKAEIWLENAAYRKAGEVSVAESAKFSATAAAGNVEAVRAGFKALTGTCVACHDKYRGPEEKK